MVSENMDFGILWIKCTLKHQNVSHAAPIKNDQSTPDQIWNEQMILSQVLWGSAWDREKLKNIKSQLLNNSLAAQDSTI